MTHTPMLRFSLLLSLAGLCFFTFSCTENEPTEQNPLMAKADSLAHAYIIADGHVDLPYRMKVKNFRLEREYLSIGEVTPEGHFDFVRARKGGLDAPFMSIFIPSSYQETPGKSFALADSLIDMVEMLVSLQPEKAAIATSPDQIEEQFSQGLISLPMGMENGAPVEGNLENLAHFHERGVRYITLTHAKDNEICDSSYDTTGTWNGLSPFGETVVAEMNRLGIMVDISHVSDSAFYQAVGLTKAPVIASHSSSRYFTPGFERNMNDDMITRVGENGGVIMINFGSYFLGGMDEPNWSETRAEVDAWMEENDGEYGSDEYNAFLSEKEGASEDLHGTATLVADHIDRVVQLAGVDHVGFGSDYDGVSNVPNDMQDVTTYPVLIAELLKRGYTEEDIEKMCYGNLFRVWREVERVAEELQSTPMTAG